MTILGHVVIKGVSGSRNSWSCLCSLVWTDGPVWFQVSHPNLVWFGYCVLKFSVQWTWAKPIFRRGWRFIRFLFPWLLQICIRIHITAPHWCHEHCVLDFWFGWVGASPVSTVWWIRSQAAVSANEIRIPQPPGKPSDGFSNSCVQCGALCFLWRKKNKSFVIS